MITILRQRSFCPPITISIGTYYVITGFAANLLRFMFWIKNHIVYDGNEPDSTVFIRVNDDAATMIHIIDR